MSENYKIQLKQVEQAIEHTKNIDQLNELLSLRDSLVELIALTSEACEPEQTTQNPLDEEYALFKSEIETIDETQNKNYDEDDTSSCEILNISKNKKVKDCHSSSTIEIDSDSDNTNSCQMIDEDHETAGIENELANLQGSKCQAPFETDYDVSTYHNALIMSVKVNDSTDQQSLDDILVTVLYTNPICKQMLPCQFFLSGECKYSDDRCYFSHGTEVPLSRLTEFKEPDFKNLKVGSLVLAKSCEGGLWSRAIVLDITHGTSNNDGSCIIKYETKGLGEIEVPMQNIFPLIGNDEEFYELSSDSDEESKIKERDSAIVNNVLLSTETIQSLGSWEKHTKGIGSKLMAKMGYIMGAGLGKNGEGRINPVEAIVLPKGKSLDHCMSIKNTEQIQEARKKHKQQLRLERCMKKSYEKSLEKPPDVFTFLNNKLNIKNINQDKNVIDEKKLKSSTIHDLNVRSLKIEEDIKRQQISIQELSYSLNRSASGSVQYNVVNQKLIEANNQLSHLKAEEKSIQKEHTNRETHKKMTVF
ncbi:zinc finger CCCH-type with G patch domain-containing protein [Melanaphis sacchari]|uniref:zinc finger CCCH-type with G patch domain-containing protein n=1 Tax=Melanaphis sacchari TaxID=742174 RepID=UPI000DC14A79|nr:zinc finger CCCH-type with G patch domain-containing protein [Melanaphis sacchari]